MFTQVVLTALLATQVSAAGLNALAQAAGKKYFGSATDNNELSDQAYVAILKNSSMFGQITPANSQKWQYIQPSQNTFSYTQGDQIVNFAKANGQIVRCHNLVWYSQLPGWVSSGSWSTSQLTSVINTHIANEAGHYKGECYAWDVVNEALNDDGTYRTDVFYNVLGTSYIPIAFKAAAAADPNAKLYYNDYNIEYAGAKQQGALKIVASIQAAGAHIDGVGFQGHFIVGQTPSRSDLSTVLKSFVTAGITEVAYTELDIRFSSTSTGSSAAGQQQQAEDYMSVVGACLDVPQCVGITIWDYTDKYSWIPSTFPGQGDACLFSSDLQPRPAFTSVSSMLAAAATTPASAAATPTMTTVARRT